MFSKLKSNLRGKKFISDEEVISSVLGHSKDKNSDYFFNDIDKLINCSKKYNIEIKIYWKIKMIIWFYYLFNTLEPETFGPYLHKGDFISQVWREQRTFIRRA